MTNFRHSARGVIRVQAAVLNPSPSTTPTPDHWLNFSTSTCLACPGCGPRKKHGVTPHLLPLKQQRSSASLWHQNVSLKSCSPDPLYSFSFRNKPLVGLMPAQLKSDISQQLVESMWQCWQQQLSRKQCVRWKQCIMSVRRRACPFLSLFLLSTAGMRLQWQELERP